jgi:hypothetical protein
VLFLDNSSFHGVGDFIGLWGIGRRPFWRRAGDKFGVNRPGVGHLFEQRD